MSTTHFDLNAFPAELVDLRDRGALFVVNHSAGKDSQAMYLYLRRHVPAAQLHVVHAELPGADWPGLVEHIAATIDPGVAFEACEAVKTFEAMVRTSAAKLQAQGRYETASPWPSPKYRQCTSDLKRGPIEKAIRHAVKGRDNKLIVNCTGIRAEESSNRAKAEVFGFSVRNSKAGREWYDWLPIHAMTEAEVFETIAAAGQEPHPAYRAGMSRLSCCFCIMASKGDTRTAATLAPEVFARYVELERELGKTMMMPAKGDAPAYLEDFAGITVEEARQAAAERTNAGSWTFETPDDDDPEPAAAPVPEAGPDCAPTRPQRTSRGPRPGGGSGPKAKRYPAGMRKLPGGCILRLTWHPGGCILPPMSTTNRNKNTEPRTMDYAAALALAVATGYFTPTTFAAAVFNIVFNVGPGEDDDPNTVATVIAVSAAQSAGHDLPAEVEDLPCADLGRRRPGLVRDWLFGVRSEALASVRDGLVIQAVAA